MLKEERLEKQRKFDTECIKVKSMKTFVNVKCNTYFVLIQTVKEDVQRNYSLKCIKKKKSSEEKKTFTFIVLFILFIISLI